MRLVISDQNSGLVAALRRCFLGMALLDDTSDDEAIAAIDSGG